jgi:hypothetical protein
MDWMDNGLTDNFDTSNGNQQKEKKLL